MHAKPRATVLKLIAALLLPMTLTSQCTSNGSSRAAELLRAQLDEDWTYWMAQYPELATSVGYPGQNSRWTDNSQPAIDARAAYLKRSLERLAGVDRAALDASGQLTLDLYRGLLDTAVKGLAFHNDAVPIAGVIPHNLLMPINQLEGVQQDVPRTLALMPSATREDYENIIARLQGVGPLVDQTIALMEQGLAAGMTPPRITLRNVPEQVKGQLVDDPLASPMLAPFRSWPPSIPESDRAGLRMRATAAFEQVVKPAFKKLNLFLESRYLPACRATTSVSALPNGVSMYAYNIKWHTTGNMSAGEIYALGLAEVARIRQEMNEVMASSGFKGTYADFARFLRTSPQFYFRDAGSLVTAYRDIAKRADPELARLFGRLPQTPYGVKPVPDAVAPSQTTAYYEQGALAAGRPANMFVNTFKLESRPKWEMETLTLHEAVPGHHLQVAIAQELQALPEFRKNSSYTAFVEGWALYAESLGDEMGFYAEPYSRFGRLTYDMWRAIRLVVDTGLHAMDWTREQAIDFFRENAAKTDQDIIVEIDRYIVWPGQALGYKIGELKIRQLRSDAERLLGSRFDVRQFHDVVLGEGAVPLDVLERQVNAWVERLASPK
jgi:uncharacterized protein (DUF885 family)